MKKLLWLMVFPLMIVGCTSYKKVPYLQNPEVVNSSLDTLPLYDAKIMPKDLLTITVNTTDPQAAAPFNLTIQDSQTGIEPYLVNNEGTIDFPVIGQLKVSGLTKDEAEALIRQQLRPYLKEVPIVTVRMANYKFSVLGEVNGPGTFTVSNEKVNILEALAMAGDMTIYGLRDNVKLIREDEHGKNEIIHLNLNDAELIMSPYYYLKQNDILYVTPNKAKAKGSDIGNSTTFWFSTSSMLFSMLNLLWNIFK